MIEVFKIKHLEDVVDLHFSVLPWSLNSRLGKDHIYKLYDSLLTDENSRGFVYIKKNKIKGIVTGTINYQYTSKLLRGNYTLNDKIKLVIMGLNPKNAFYLFDNTFLIPRFLKRNININSQIITLVTCADEFIRPFAAVACFDAMKKYLNSKGQNEIFAQVASFDPDPNNFYQKGLKIKPVKKFFRNYFYKINTNK